MRAALALGSLALAVAAASALLPTAGAEPAASRVVDETVSCSVPVLTGGLREIEVSARSGVRDFADSSKWRFLASASMSVPGRNAGHASLGAGAPVSLEPGVEDTNVRLRISTACTRTRAEVPLGRSGLLGGRAGPLEESWDCRVVRRVLIRVRAVFRAPTRVTLERRTGFGLTVVTRVAKGTIRSGELAVRTPDGRPISYADVHEAGRARLFVSNRCVPD